MKPEIEQLIEQTKQLSPEDKLQLIERMGNPTKLEANNPWLAIAGSLSEDPFFDNYLAEIERYRQELDRIKFKAERGLEQVKAGNVVDGETVFTNLR